MSKVALITGTSTGVGLAASALFAKNGYRVYATMRDTKKSQALLEEAKKNNVEVQLLPLDVSDNDSVEKAVADIISREGRIDLLINNAGAGFIKTVEQASWKEINWVLDVNYLGIIRTTKAVLPHMRKARQGHIINLSSVGGLVGQPFNELYCGAKFAVEGFTESLAAYITPNFNVKFTVVEPGPIATEFVNSVMSTSAGVAEDDYTPALKSYFGAATKKFQTGAASPAQTPLQVAEVLLKVAQQQDPPVRIRTSAYAEEFAHLKTSADPDGTKQVAVIAGNSGQPAPEYAKK